VNRNGISFFNFCWLICASFTIISEQSSLYKILMVFLPLLAILILYLLYHVFLDTVAFECFIIVSFRSISAVVFIRNLFIIYLF
jgi:hypothetical protein